MTLKTLSFLTLLFPALAFARQWLMCWNYQTRLAPSGRLFDRPTNYLCCAMSGTSIAILTLLLSWMTEQAVSRMPKGAGPWNDR